MTPTVPELLGAFVLASRQQAQEAFEALHALSNRLDPHVTQEVFEAIDDHLLYCDELLERLERTRPGVYVR